MDAVRAHRPAPGELAPQLALRNHHGETVELHDLTGSPVLVMFYPFAFSRVCSAELTEVHLRWEEFHQAGAHLLAISCDAVHTLRAYAEHLAADAPQAERAALHLLSDFWPHGAVAQRYGVLNAATGAPQRVSFLLDPELRIRHQLVSEDGDPRSLDHTLELLRSL